MQSTARASEPQRDELAAPYACQAADRSPLDVLALFADDHGLRLRVAPSGVNRSPKTWRTARLTGWLRAQTGRDFLDQLASTHHFDWFVANRILHISSRSESTIARIGLNGVDAEAARTALSAIRLYEARFGWGVLPGQDAVLVSAPREYVSLVRRFLAKQPAAVVARSGDASREPMIFALRHAQAADGGPFGPRGPVRRGVASLLRELIGQQRANEAQRFVLPSAAQLAGSVRGTSSLPSPLPATGPTSWLGVRHDAPPLPNTLPPTLSDWGVDAGALPVHHKGDVVIVGDERTNSILVWGDPALRAPLARIIAALDQQQPMVSLEVLVLESDDAALTQVAPRDAPDLAARDPASEWLQALGERRVRLLNRQRIVGFANRHLTLTIGAQTANVAAASSEPSADNDAGRAGRRGDALDLVARVLPARATGRAVIAVDVGLAMAQPTGLPGQAWASTSSVELTSGVALEAGAAPQLVAIYAVATSRDHQRAILLSADTHADADADAL